MYTFFCTCQTVRNDTEKWLTHILNHIGSAKLEYLYRLLSIAYKRCFHRKHAKKPPAA